MKQIIKYISDFLKKFISVVLKVGITFGVMYLLSAAGIKGMFGFLAGVAFMSFVILSKNSFFMWFVSLFESQAYLEEVSKIGKKEKKEKSSEAKSS